MHAKSNTSSKEIHLPRVLTTHIHSHAPAEKSFSVPKDIPHFHCLINIFESVNNSPWNLWTSSPKFFSTNQLQTWLTDQVSIAVSCLYTCRVNGQRRDLHYFLSGCCSFIYSFIIISRQLSNFYSLLCQTLRSLRLSFFKTSFLNTRIKVTK